MKRFVNPFLACLAAAVCLFASCEKDDYWVGKAEDPEPEQVAVDDALILLHSFLALDESGKVTGATMGSYDPQRSGEVAITAAGYKAALALLKAAIPAEADTQEQDGQFVWNLKDAAGKTQGQLVMKPSSAPGEVAVAEVPSCASPLTRIVFKKPLLFNAKADKYNYCDELDPFYLGAKIRIETGKLPANAIMESELGGSRSYPHGKGDFIVIQEYEYGVHNGILLRLENEDYNWFTESSADIMSHFHRCSNLSDLIVVRNILAANPAFLSTMSTMGMASWDNKFMVHPFVSNEFYRWHLKDGGGVEQLCVFNWYYKEALLYHFYPYEWKGKMVVVINHERNVNENKTD